MKDVLEQEINIGDTVFHSGGKTQYAGFTRLQVMKITEKRVLLSNGQYIHPMDVVVIDKLLQILGL